MKYEAKYTEKYPEKVWPKDLWPEKLQHVSPHISKLFIRGEAPPENIKFITIVGPRKMTEYGKLVTEYLISGLRGLPVCIVSGLAYGIDAWAHECALKNNLRTLSFPGSTLKEYNIYPRAHLGLAHRILDSGGCLVSEYEHKTPNLGVFPLRNRLMAGIADLVIVIEARKLSGTLITARLATDFNTNLAIIPQNIFSETYEGVHSLLADGAYPVANPKDIKDLLGFNDDLPIENKYLDLTDQEKLIMEIIREPKSLEELQKLTGINIQDLLSIISLLEIKGLAQQISDKIAHKFN